MKKTVVVFFMILLSVFFSYGDYIHFKLDLGRHSAYIENTNRIVYKEAKYDISGGISAEFNFSRAFAFEVGAFYKNYRAASSIQHLLTDENKFVYYTPVYSVKYLSVPTYFKLYFLNEEISPYLLAGVDFNFYLTSKYSYEDPENTGLGPYDGKYKSFRVFLDLGLGVILAPDSLGIEVEFHIVNDFGFMFETDSEDDYNVRINGIELVIGKRF